MDYQTGHVLTLANSIIGVSILAMPYCFKQCGIILSTFILLASNVISRLSCHFLLKSAILSRRKTFEYLAFHIFGGLGKFFVEIGMIGFLLGTCVAFFVVMGDLGPEIVTEMTGAEGTSTLRTTVLIVLALCCVLPLGLLKNIDSLEGVSRATIGFYCCLVLKVVVEALPHIFTGDWINNVNLWRPAGILQCLPIFTMALFCQTQLFEIYQAVPNASLDKMNNLIRVAVNICTWVYTFVGIFGYLAFFPKNFTGNILLSFRQSLMSDVLKMGFVLSLGFSFPLVIFPCRNSLYSLLYKKPSYTAVHEGSTNYIPEDKFRILTFLIVLVSLVIGIMIPNIELVLGLVGSTIGVLICVIFPATCFICVSSKNTNERLFAQFMLAVGILVMVLGTYANLYAFEGAHLAIVEPLHKNIQINEKKLVFRQESLLISSMKPLLKEEEENDIRKIAMGNKSAEDKNQAPVVQSIKDKQQPVVEPPQNPVKEKKNIIEVKEKQEPVVEPQIPKEEKKNEAEVKEKQAPVVEPQVPVEEIKNHEVKEKQEPVVEPQVPVEEIKNDVVKEKREPVVEPQVPVEDNRAEVKEKQEPVLEPQVPAGEIKKIVIEKPSEKPVKKAQPPEKAKEVVVEPPVDLQPQNKPEVKELRNKDLVVELAQKNKPDEVDIEAIKKEDKELKEQQKEKNVEEILIDTIQKQNEVQKVIVEQQKKLIEVIQKQQQKEKIDKVVNEEKLKAVKQIESIALKAIESIKNQNEDNSNLTVVKKTETKNNLSLPIPLILNNKASDEFLNKNKNDVKDELNKEIKEAKAKIEEVVKNLDEPKAVETNKQNNEIKLKVKENEINKEPLKSNNNENVLQTLINIQENLGKEKLPPTESRLNRDILADKTRLKREVIEDKTASTENKRIIKERCELSEPDNVPIKIDNNLQMKKVLNLPQEKT